MHSNYNPNQTVPNIVLPQQPQFGPARQVLAQQANIPGFNSNQIPAAYDPAQFQMLLSQPSSVAMQSNLAQANAVYLEQYHAELNRLGFQANQNGISAYNAQPSQSPQPSPISSVGSSQFSPQQHSMTSPSSHHPLASTSPPTYWTDRARSEQLSRTHNSLSDLMSPNIQAYAAQFYASAQSLKFSPTESSHPQVTQRTESQSQANILTAPVLAELNKFVAAKPVSNAKQESHRNEISELKQQIRKLQAEKKELYDAQSKSGLAVSDFERLMEKIHQLTAEKDQALVAKESSLAELERTKAAHQQLNDNLAVQDLRIRVQDAEIGELKSKVMTREDENRHLTAQVEKANVGRDEACERFQVTHEKLLSYQQSHLTVLKQMTKTQNDFFGVIDKKTAENQDLLSHIQKMKAEHENEIKALHAVIERNSKVHLDSLKKREKVIQNQRGLASLVLAQLKTSKKQNEEQAESLDALQTKLYHVQEQAFEQQFVLAGVEDTLEAREKDNKRMTRFIKYAQAKYPFLRDNISVKSVQALSSLSFLRASKVNGSKAESVKSKVLPERRNQFK